MVEAGVAAAVELYADDVQADVVDVHAVLPHPPGG
jgi:transketolase C-terminal domain/subunit